VTKHAARERLRRIDRRHLLHGVGHVLEWQIGWITPAWSDAVWALNLSLEVSLAANAVFFLHDHDWFRYPVLVVCSLAALQALFVLYALFPFDFGGSRNDIAWLALPRVLATRPKRPDKRHNCCDGPCYRLGGCLAHAIEVEVVAAEGVQMLAHQWRGLGQHRVVDNVTLGAQLLDQFADVDDVRGDDGVV
jgi:hypothetical protein